MKKRLLPLLALHLFLAEVSLAQPGALDVSFGNGGTVVMSVYASVDYAANAVLQPDGKVVLAGNHTYANSNLVLVRYETDGALDAGFGTAGVVTIGNLGKATALLIQPDGKFIAATTTSVIRINTDGTPDTSFGLSGVHTIYSGAFSGNIAALALQPDGKIVVAGSRIYRLLTTGEKDPAFVSNATFYTDFEQRAVAVQANGDILVAGKRSNDFTMIRFYPNGPRDLDFGFVKADFGGTVDELRSMALQPDGKIVLAGNSQQANGGRDFALARFHPGGTRDSSFHANGLLVTELSGYADEIRSVVLQPDGKIVAAGYSYNDFALARYRPDGTRDSSFSADGLLRIGFGASSIVNTALILPDGKIILAGASNEDFALARVEPDGTPDAGFGKAGKVLTNITTVPAGSHINAIALQPDGKIAAAGYLSSGDCALARLNTDGTPDKQLGHDGVIAFGGTLGSFCCDALSIRVQPNGKIVLGNQHFACGQFSEGEWVEVARYHPDGTPDESFGGLGTGVQSTPFDNSASETMVFQPDGKILTAGWGVSSRIIRLNPDGSYDETFGSGGIVTNNEFLHISALAVQADGKIVASGNDGGNGGVFVARYLPDGTPDAGFGFGGLQFAGFGSYDLETGLALQADGKIVVAGSKVSGAFPNTLYKVVIARFNPDGYVDSTFGSNGLRIADFGDMGGIALQSDGKIILAGTASDNFALARYDKDGSPDATFGAGGLLTTDLGGLDRVHSIALQSDAKIVVAGESAGNFALARYLSGLETGLLEPARPEPLLLIVSPNPVSDFLKLHLPEGVTTPVGVQVFDTQGRLVMQSKLSVAGEALRVQELMQGIYVLKVTVDTRVYAGRFVKQ